MYMVFISFHTKRQGQALKKIFGAIPDSTGLDLALSRTARGQTWHYPGQHGLDLALSRTARGQTWRYLRQHFVGHGAIPYSAGLDMGLSGTALSWTWCCPSQRGARISDIGNNIGLDHRIIDDRMEKHGSLFVFISKQHCCGATLKNLLADGRGG